MLAHPDDFMPFLPSITGEDSAGATEHDGLITEQEFKKYCSLVAETGEWGGEPEVCRLSFACEMQH
jgi:OTU domain-containing protein 6